MISQNLKQPKTITVATYQALHSAINRLEGDAEVEDTDDVVENEHFDFKDVDIIKLFKEANLGTLCPMSVITCEMNGGRVQKPSVNPLRI